MRLVTKALKCLGVAAESPTIRAISIQREREILFTKG